MNKLLICIIFIIYSNSTLTLAQQSSKINYRVNENGSVLIKSKEAGDFLITSTFIILKRKDNPSLHFENQSKNLEKYKDAVTVPCWTSLTNTITPDYFQTAEHVTVSASSSIIKDNIIYWSYAENDQYSLEASLELNKENPKIIYRFISKNNSYYSIGYAGMPQFNPGSLNEILQPWIWQGKRFPETSYLSTEDMCPLPAVLLNKDGVTSGLVSDPEYIPYRLPALRKGNIKFGLMIRNETGKVQCLLFSPVLGNPDSYIKSGDKFSFAFFIILKKANISDTHQFIAEHIFKFKDYRQNVFNSLNTTIENMIAYGTNNTYNGWDAELKGFDYTLDVAKTVKVVSGLHPLSVAAITDNESIYWNLALPMTEFNLSREKFLFSAFDNVTGQNVSSKLDGPGIEVAELTALNSYYKNHSPIFRYFADSLKNTVRKLNLGIKSDGSSWPNLIGLYKESRNSTYLAAAIKGADEYINQRINQEETDFKFAGGDETGKLSTGSSSHFWTDYTPKWMELLDLYELTGDRKYLDASLKGAKKYAQYVWFSPKIPNTSYTTAYLKEQVPAWRVSQIGLTPEAANTFPENPGIFLAQFAAHFLRLAYYSNDAFLRSIARSAVIGRYSNFPGYTIQDFDTMYSRPDYPYNSNLHGLFYYNHIWPQIALLFDYLISDAFVQSQSNINFPNEFVPAYAYLKSRVYGEKAGRFYTDTGVNLWMPKQLLNIDNEQINYVSGYGNGNFYVALLNQSDKPIDAIVKINPDLTSLDVNHKYQVRMWTDNAPVSSKQLSDGELRVSVSAKGIIAFSVDSLSIHPQFQQKIYKNMEVKQSDESYRLLITPVGKLSSAVISLGDNLKSFYIWSDALPNKIGTFSLQYRIEGTDKWKTYVDNSYPYEFNVRLNEISSRIEYKATFSDLQGHQLYQTPLQTLQIN